MAVTERRNKKTVVAAAAELTDRDGLAELSLSRVASVLGLHVSSLYNHIDGLDGLRHAVATQALEELGEELWRAALGRSGADALESLARAYRRYIMGHPERFKMVLLNSTTSPEYFAALARIAAAIEPIMNSLGYTGVDAVHAHRLFSSMIIGFVVEYELAKGIDGPPVPPLDDTFEHLVSLIRSAFRSSDPQPPAPAGSVQS
jgi:AcrR family transcriptional regulator